MISLIMIIVNENRIILGAFKENKYKSWSNDLSLIYTISLTLWKKLLEFSSFWLELKGKLKGFKDRIDK